MQTTEKRYELPSRKYFAEHVIPDMCERLKVKIAEMISDINYISYTTDTWTADTTTQSFIGITGHWLTDYFVRHSVVFQCIAFDEHHTAKNLLEHFEMMLEKWTIAREKCHVVVRDNALPNAFVMAAIQVSDVSHTYFTAIMWNVE